MKQGAVSSKCGQRGRAHWTGKGDTGERQTQTHTAGRGLCRSLPAWGEGEGAARRTPRLGRLSSRAPPSVQGIVAVCGLSVSHTGPYIP